MKPNIRPQIATNALQRIFSTVLLLAVSLSNVNAQIPRPNEPPKYITLTSQWHGFKRDVVDRDGDGWDDIWRLICRINHRDRTKDTDLDGVTDYEEMILNRDPNVKGPLPAAPLTPEQIAKEAENAARTKEANEKLWAARKAEIDKVAAPEMPAGKAEADRLALKAADDLKMNALHTNVARKEAVDMAAARAILRQVNQPERFIDRLGNPSVLAGIDNGMPFFISSHNQTAVDTISADEIRAGGSLGLDLSGEIPAIGNNSATPIRIGMWEIGDPLISHTEYLNIAGTSVRVVDKDGTQSTSEALAARWHATHVGGTLIARGVLSSAKGFAFKAALHAYDTLLQFTEMTTVNSNNDPTDDLLISNHSYGRVMGWISSTATDGVNTYPVWNGPITASFAEDAYFGYYDSNAQSVDQISYTRKTWLPIWSSGNDRLQAPAVPPVSAGGGLYRWVVYSNGSPTIAQGPNPPSNDGNPSGYDSVGSYGVAKNTLTVGAVADLVGGYVNAGSVSYSSFSAAGPTDDGRIKPDVVANGEGVTSPASDAYFPYATADGTSQAAPGVAGALGLLLEHFQRLYGTSRLPWASTLKGLVIHTADEAGDAPGPDYRGGWGVMNAKRAAQMLSADAANGNSPYLLELTLTNAGPINFQFKAIGGTANPIKVTIVWTDPAGAVTALLVDSATGKLINDVDLRVTKPDTTDALPFVLDPANPANAATAGDNNKDNVEQVVIDNPTAGATYTVKITPSTGVTLVNELGQAANQHVSVFLSGVKEERFFPQVTATGAATYSLVWPASYGSVYRVESTTDLVTWSEVSGDLGPATTNTISYTPSSTSEARRFWRVKRVQ